MLDTVKDYVEYVFKNYLSNAVQNAGKGTTITVSLNKRNDVIRLSVENQGKQIPDDLCDKIWTEAFTTFTENSDNTGLGLYIVKEISLIEHTDCGFDNTETGVRFWFDFIDCSGDE
jgi:signal transduction histidine kinase